MAENKTITFGGATLVKLSRDRGKSGKAAFTADISNKVVNAMGWTHPLDHETSVSLDGTLAAIHATLGMKGTLKDSYEVKLDIGEVSGFQATRRETKGKRGKGFRHVLSFYVKFAADELGKLERYMDSVPDDKGTLTVVYAPQAVQAEIVDVVTTEEQRQAVLEEE